MRIARFGYFYLKEFFESHVEVEVLNPKEQEELQQELVNDLVAIVSFLQAESVLVRIVNAKF